MNYVSTIIGTLKIDDINLELHHMELISLGSADFKASPKLREAYRAGQLVDYDPLVHKKAKKFKNFTRKNKGISTVGSTPEKEVNFSDSISILTSLKGISKKMDSLVGRINVLVSKTLESNKDLNKNFNKFFEENSKNKFDVDKFNIFMEKTIEYHSKIDTHLSEKISENDKFDKLFDKLDEFIKKGVKINQSNTGSSQYNGKGGYRDFEDIPTFVPEIEVSSVETSIKSKKTESKSTQDILKKLQELKK